MSLYYLHCVQAGSTTISGIGRHSIDLGAEVRAESTDGASTPRATFLTAIKPRASFETCDVGAALTGLGAGPASIATLTGLSFWLQSQDGPTVSSTGLKRTIAVGLVCPDRVSVSHGGDAVISYSAAATSNGTDAVVAIATGTLPTISNPAARYTLGPVKVGNIALTGVRSLDISFGAQIGTEGADGSLYDTESSVSGWRPTVTIRGISPLWFGAATIPLGGVAAIHSNTTFYLRQRKSGAALWLDNEAKHVLFSVAGMAHARQSHDASGRQLATCEIQITACSDGSNPMVKHTADVAVA